MTARWLHKLSGPVSLSPSELLLIVISVPTVARGLRLLGEIPDPHVLDHALTKRGHDALLGKRRGNHRHAGGRHDSESAVKIEGSTGGTSDLAARVMTGATAWTPNSIGDRAVRQPLGARTRCSGSRRGGASDVRPARG